MKCKVRILKPLDGVYPKYQPKVGEVYDAIYTSDKYKKYKKSCYTVCIITVLDKKICLKKDEYERIEE